MFVRGIGGPTGTCKERSPKDPEIRCRKPSCHAGTCNGKREDRVSADDGWGLKITYHTWYRGTHQITRVSWRKL